MWDNLLSFHFITDLGSKDECQNYGNNTFVHLDANVTHLPVSIFMGICVPSVACTQDDMSSLADAVTNKLNGALDFVDDTLPNGLNTFGIGVIQTNLTRTQMRITDSDY